VTLDLLLDAQRRRAEAESAYYRSVIDYNKAIMNVHYRKGSLLDYNGVYLAEGPWPGKAYFDALREARKRDASMYLDYGFTRPNVMSRGPYQQLTGEECETGVPYDGMEMQSSPEEAIGPEEVMPTPADAPLPPQEPAPPSDNDATGQTNSTTHEAGRREAQIAGHGRSRQPESQPAANEAVHSAAAPPIWEWARR
jgi:hypothetical protein